MLEGYGVSVYIRREDLIHPVISGNKYRKLKYNLLQAAEQGKTRLLTFGGAFSNHIAATARAGREFGFSTVGIIRGDELAGGRPLNPTLEQARADGMKLQFISREVYRQKDTNTFITGLEETYGPFYLLPEGGTNALAVKGCEEILEKGDASFEIICCCVGTGGTLAGLINASGPDQELIGFPAMKGDFLKKDICSFVGKSNWRLENGYHFGGYAKINKELVAFINNFRELTGIPLDPVYTGKMFYGIVDMIRLGKFKKGTRILAIHSGGLQGIAGMNQVLKQKKLPLISL
jgi:1-aminocyclopropane-1-carboxylate deaminase